MAERLRATPSYDVFPRDKFYFDHIHQTSTFCLFGASRSGKTTMTRLIWENFFKGTHGVICMLGNPKAQSNGWMYSRKRPGEPRKGFVIFEGLQPAVIQFIHIIQTISPHLNWRWLIVIDDILEIHGSKLVNNLLMSYRNACISTIISIQAPKMSSPAQRNNPNNILCGFFGLPEKRKEMLDLVIGRRTMDEKQYEQMTQDHGWICRNMVEDEPFFHVRIDLQKDGRPQPIADIEIPRDDDEEDSKIIIHKK